MDQDFGARLFRLRKEHGISQEELANIIGVSRQAVQKWESGASRPDMDNLTALSDYFGVSLDHLVRGAEGAVYSDLPPGSFDPWHYEYISPHTLFGLPLLHVNLGHGKNFRARGIVAVGNSAIGLVAVGYAAVGLVALGLVAVGLLAFGLLTVGLLLAAGAVSVGAVALGGIAVGYFAAGGIAVGAYALGGLAVGSNIAGGGMAVGHVAIGDVTKGELCFPKGSPDTVPLLSALHREFPHLPCWFLQLFTLIR